MQVKEVQVNRSPKDIVTRRSPYKHHRPPHRHHSSPSHPGPVQYKTHHVDQHEDTENEKSGLAVGHGRQWVGVAPANGFSVTEIGPLEVADAGSCVCDAGV